jgi:hypothetical protein
LYLLHFSVAISTSKALDSGTSGSEVTHSSIQFSDVLILTVCFQFINFGFQIFPLFAPEMSWLHVLYYSDCLRYFGLADVATAFCPLLLITLPLLEPDVSSNAFSFCYVLSVSDEDSRPSKTTGEVTVPCVSVFVFLCSRQKHKNVWTNWW